MRFNTLVFWLFALCIAPFAAYAQLFTPGNIVIADPFYNAGAENGQVVELRIEGDSAEIVQAIRWERDWADRRRPLPLDVDAEGNIWVGITSSTDDPETEFPLGIGEVIRIAPDGSQTIYFSSIDKMTFLTVTGPNEVIASSNGADANFANLMRIEGDDVVHEEYFNKTSYGEAIRLPDGRLLMADNGNSGIHIFVDGTSNSTGKLYDDGRNFRSLTYNDEIGAVIAMLTNEQTLLRISLDGELEDEYDAGADGFTNCWDIEQIPGQAAFMIANHNIGADNPMRNVIGVYNALDLQEPPRLIRINAGFANIGAADTFTFRSIFNMAMIPGADFPVSVETWNVY